MNILAVDTASRTCSVAVMEDGQVAAEFTAHHRDTHSRFLMDMIDQSLAVSRFTLVDMDGFAVTIGPGSFTGLRIGLSTVKGLALAMDRPVVGIGTLEALAFPFAFSGKLICPLLDARRQEVYAALYRPGGGRLAPLKPAFVACLDDVLLEVREPCMFVGDGAAAYRDRILEVLPDRALIADAVYHPVRASAAAALAMPRLLAGQADDPAALTPWYIRSSDAVKMQNP